jgi:hypothetical protein
MSVSFGKNLSLGRMAVVIVGKLVLEDVEREGNAMGKVCKQVENERNEEGVEGYEKEGTV